MDIIRLLELFKIIFIYFDFNYCNPYLASLHKGQIYFFKFLINISLLFRRFKNSATSGGVLSDKGGIWTELLSKAWEYPHEGGNGS